MNMKRQSDIALADNWAIVNGVNVVRIGESKFVAVPTSPRKNSRKFDIIDIEAGEFICQVEKAEVWHQLHSRII